MWISSFKYRHVRVLKEDTFQISLYLRSESICLVAGTRVSFFILFHAHQVGVKHLFVRGNFCMG